jgi:hypothetical protein
MDQIVSTVRQEAEIGRRHTPDFGGQTLLLEVGLFAIFIGATWLTMAGVIPMWLGALANTIFIYSLYTVVHEALHSNISSRTKSLRWLDTMAGVIACVPLWLHYHQHKRQHLQHHAHTNEESDPDIYAKGSFLAWVFLRAPAALLSYFNPVQQYWDCKRFQCTRGFIYTSLVSGLRGNCHWPHRGGLWPGSVVPVVRAMVDRPNRHAHLLHLDAAPRPQRNGALPQHARFPVSWRQFPLAGAELPPDSSHDP